MKSKLLANLGLVSVLLFAAAGARAGTTDLANAPLVTSSSSSVQPNLLLLLDDSGSMAWNYLPDWANTSNQALFTNNAYNGVAYSAAVTYNPPVWYNSDGTINTTTYPSMTSANTSAWGSVPRDGYGVQSSGTSNLVGNASFYTFVAGEYCAQPNLLNCVTQSAPSVTYPYPAALRWCTNSAMTTCHALRIETGTTYLTPRYPSPAKSTITIIGTSSTSVTGITVNGVQIMSSATPSATSASTMAGYIASRITLAGFSAATTTSGTGVIITSPPGTGSMTYTPVVAKSGSMTILASAFAGGVPGQNVYTSIVSGNNSYPFPGTSAKASTRTDCIGATCTYAEEMTNYANWYAYYRTRMQMMKSSTSIAFQTVGPNYRIGYDTINNNQGSAFINPATFSTANKLAWYTKLFAASPNNSTPLRVALSQVGRFYAGMLNGSSINSVTVTDPMQYSCQQNFTIMATDGYWNETTDPTQMDGSTAIGNQDASEPRPFNDGGSATITAATPTVSTSTDTTPRTVVNQATRTDTTITTTSQSRTDGYVRVRVTSTNAGCGIGIATQTWRLYNGASTETQTTTTTTSTNYNVITTTGYSDAATTTTTATRTVVSTGGVVTSDTTTTTTAGPTTVTTVTSGPTVVMNPSGTPVTTTIGPTTTFNPAATLAAINWGSPYSTFTNCGAYTTSDDLYLVSNGTWSAPNTSGPTTTPGSPTQAPGYPQTSNGTTVTTTTGPTPGTTTTSTATTGGTSNTLADVAEYYYANDLRTPALGNCTGSTGLPVCDNNVPSSGLDAASWQHMTLFTMALGASGYMQYFPTYATALSGDYFDVKNGTTANPGGGVCSWQAGGACNWPVPVSNTQTTIDDLWHAAINGRGAYFSATNPTTLNAGLTSALAGVSARTGSSAAATTSNPNVTSGDNFVFSSTFTTQQWDGELVEQTLDLTTGVVSTTPTWTSQTQLDNNRTAPGTSPPLPRTARLIYTFQANGGNNLTPFTWATLNTTQQSYFQLPYISTLSQFCVSGITCLPPTSQSNTTAGGANLVAFLGGDRTHEGVATDTSTYYRQRSHILGDIVNAEAVYVKRPLYKYGDAGYLAWADAPAQAGRQGMVYVAGNDGMLHAFDASNGAEAWAYIPSMVLPNMYKLADKNYTAKHQYFVDGTPVVGDVYIGGAWRTILVGGLNHGGRGYYALDITDPLNPIALWEFTDANLGYTYGNPTITKLQNGKWVVLVTSGYNNVPDANYATGDGVGRLYILDARTGAQLGFSPISTGTGNVAAPSGLARISAWVDHADTDNTALRVYGGDMLGNLWRFDINNNVGAAGYDAQNLMTAYTDTAGTTAQPITTRPELGSCAGAPVVFFGTGRFLGVSDLGDTTQQSFYAVKDRLGSTSFPNPQVSTSNFVQQTEIDTTCPTGSPSTICTLGQQVRTSTSNAVNFASNNGWYINFPDAGERANTDPVLALGTLGWTTNIPNTNACTAGGTSFTNLVNYCTGAPVVTSTTGVMGVKLGNALATRAVFVRLPNNTVVQLTRLSDGTTLTTDVPISASCPTCARRISWRELIQDQ